MNKTVNSQRQAKTQEVENSISHMARYKVILQETIESKSKEIDNLKKKYDKANVKLQVEIKTEIEKKEKELEEIELTLYRIGEHVERCVG